MVIPHVIAKVFAGEDSGDIPILKRKKPMNAIVYASENLEFLKGKYLGAILDSCRIGTMTTCLWPTNFGGLLKLIDAWGKANSWNENLYHDVPVSDFYTKFELPWINHENCPRDVKHLKTFFDAAGRIRCAHREVTRVKPSFISSYNKFDHFSQMNVDCIYKDEPEKTYEGDGDYAWENYQTQMRRFKSERPVDCVDVCYSIINEPVFNMPLETVFRRLNIHPETKTHYCGNDFDRLCDKSRVGSGMCAGHVEDSNMVEFCFDGWTMAHYVQKWKEQRGASMIARIKEHWPSREYLRICSED